MCYFLVTTLLKSFSTIAYGSLLKIPDENLRTWRILPSQIPVVSHNVHRRRPAPDESLNSNDLLRFFRAFIANENLFSIAVKRDCKLVRSSYSQSDLNQRVGPGGLRTPTMTSRVSPSRADAHVVAVKFSNDLWTRDLSKSRPQEMFHLPRRAPCSYSRIARKSEQSTIPGVPSFV